MKTLLFLLDRYPAFGGVETVTTVLANSLAEHYRIIICSQRGEEKHDLLHRLMPGIIVRKLPQGSPKAVLTALDSLLTEESVSIVIFQDSYARNEFLAYHIAQRDDVKLIVAEHSAPSQSIRWVNSFLALPWWDLYHRLKYLYFNGLGHLNIMHRRSMLYRLCDRYIVLSEQLKHEFRRYSSVPESSKLSAIGNPVSYMPAECVSLAKQKQLLFIGQFVALKGLDRLLRIWEKVQDTAEEWSLILVGDGPQMGEIKEHICTHQLKRVAIEGFRTNVRDYCESAAILCLCSDFEGFPMVLPEAMCSGAVPICFNSFSSLADIITDGVDGCSIPAFDEEAYAERLLRLMQNDKLRQRMAEAAYAKSAKFSLRAVSEKWQALFEELLSAAP